MAPKTVDCGEKVAQELFFFGGVYSNYHAYHAFKQIMEQKTIDASSIICTGDIVAYCAHPLECIEETRSWGIASIAGNVEQQLGTSGDDCGCGFNDGSLCNILSRQWYTYADQHVSSGHRRWLRSLPDHLTFTFAGKRFLVVHGTPDDTSGFIFRSTPWAIKQAYFDRFDVDVIICGHSGIPSLEIVNGNVWFNAGVIGMPANDGTTRTWYGRCRNEESRNEENRLLFSLHALEYDAVQACHDMAQAGLPEEYAQTLKDGLWCSCDILPPHELSEMGKPLQELTQAMS
ncbi:MAG: metallophosphoesterase family protein [Cyanobacteria bacterium P01_E01_bin.6]